RSSNTTPGTIRLRWTMDERTMDDASLVSRRPRSHLPPAHGTWLCHAAGVVSDEWVRYNGPVGYRKEQYP
ncbi:MAG: hypothetical protein AAB403_06775, partial [Planctomycetota bacterium]